MEDEKNPFEEFHEDFKNFNKKLWLKLSHFGLDIGHAYLVLIEIVIMIALKCLLNEIFHY